MATFPLSLCAIRFSDHAEQPSPVVARSDVERGLPRHRRIAADALVAVSCTLLFTSNAAAAAFETWFYGEALGGGGWFSFTLPRTGQVVSARVRGGDIGALKPQSNSWEWSERSITLEYVRPSFQVLTPGLHPVDASRIVSTQRNSTATYIDSAGVLQTAAANVPRYSPRYGLANRLRFSRALQNAVWVKSAAGTGAAPVATDGAAVGVSGNQTASLVVFNLGAGSLASDISTVVQNVAVATTVGATYTTSFAVKAATPADVGKIILHRHVAGAGYQLITLTDQYQVAGTTAVSVGGSFEMGLRGSFSASGGMVSVLVDEIQLEAGSVRTEALATGAEAGLSADAELLVEAEGTNLVLQSQALNTAPWSGGCSAVSSTPPWMGSVPIFAIAKTTSGGSEARTQTVADAVSAGGQRTLTLALLGHASTPLCDVGLADSAFGWGGSAFSSAEIISGPGSLAQVGGGLWQVSGLTPLAHTLIRITRTYQAASANVSVWIYPGSASSTTIGHTVLATRVQLGPTDGSYIPTTAAPVTRAADLITVAA